MFWGGIGGRRQGVSPRHGFVLLTDSLRFYLLSRVGWQDVVLCVGGSEGWEDINLIQHKTFIAFMPL